MRSLMITVFVCICSALTAQNIAAKLTTALKDLEADPQFKHAIVSLYVVDSKTGKAVFAKNEETGMAPASCQKVITSATAFELLGKDFRYATYVGKDYATDNRYDAGCLFIIGSGDPTLGSWRWKSTSDTVVFSQILAALRKRNIFSFEENLVIQDNSYGLTPVPDGWIWQDIGNYYGAACFGLNWHENQYDLLLRTGEKGSLTRIIETKPELPGVNFKNMITTGPAGSGDNGYLYSVPFSNLILAKGTVPLQSSAFTISGSMPDPSAVLKKALFGYLLDNKVSFKGNSFSTNAALIGNRSLHAATHIIDSIMSPPLDSMNYWFLKRSINLYGEAFLKSLVKKKLGFGIGDDTYTKAITIVKDFWKDKGIDPSALNIIDGSGLSTGNRVTTNALVAVMQYAKQQPWFSSFYYDLPEMNGIKMKDGYINGVRSYTGYIKSRNGPEYTFSFIVNNFDGNAGTVREKMWRILDILK